MADFDHTRWRSFSHTIDVLLSSALAQNDGGQASPNRPILLYAMPAAAAASDGGISEQSDETVSWKLVASRRPGNFALIVTWKVEGQSPSQLVVESAEGLEFAMHTLPPPDPDGKIRVRLDEHDQEDARFLSMLRRPQSRKVFEQA